MKKLWLKAGKLLWSSNRITSCPDCPCQQSSGDTPNSPSSSQEQSQSEEFSYLPLPCGPCLEGMSVCWHLSVSGVTNDSDCQFCNVYNGDFLLSKNNVTFPFGCVFTDDTDGHYRICPDDPALYGNALYTLWVWKMFYTTDFNGNQSWVLVASGGGNNPNRAAKVYVLNSGNPCQNEHLTFIPDDTRTWVDSWNNCGNWPATLSVTPASCV